MRMLQRLSTHSRIPLRAEVFKLWVLVMVWFVQASLVTCFYVWNPFTGEYKVILRTRDDGCSRKCIIVTGFGYDPRTCDYKFVRIFHRPDSDVSEVEMYNLGSDSWKAYNSCINYEFSRGETWVFLKGALHWLAYSHISNKYGQLSLVSIDLEDGVFKEIPLPKHKDDFDYIFVDVFRGCLCLLCSVSEVNFEIWEMKDYRVRESWSKVFKTCWQQRMIKGIRSRD
ncbi:F-box/kelch-repeat protein At3g06240-like [Papaver somniferum]|uniref:F-box/kelch-repeat protein At3g06240-like n=1 Tax=Papaver somniferum TaxID=3469 RepID=UPI000E6F7F45|nr:F-box/kelch-repeat protein At3g06240-like [Papaver somniferum]